jgi:hypothetical protein
LVAGTNARGFQERAFPRSGSEANPLYAQWFPVAINANHLLRIYHDRCRKLSKMKKLPAHRAGLAGHLPVAVLKCEEGMATPNTYCLLQVGLPRHILQWGIGVYDL